MTRKGEGMSSTHDKPRMVRDASKVQERRGAKRPYQKPTVADFVQAAVAFGSPTDYYTCAK